MSDFHTPALAKWGMAAGLVIGLLSGNGIWAIALGLSFLWFGNAISGLLTGKIISHLGQHVYRVDYYARNDSPLGYWFCVASELLVGLMALTAFFTQPG